ncbi:uncharacterized protein isoform X2 [Choristoneura fumiferana]|uniref:uncharacterized protein isoform X2 n=1 Tax=Choristoneura fumiferana TaxID=7141 RepID=UPI003D15546A
MPSLTLILTLFLAADVGIHKAFAQVDLQNILQALQLQLQHQQDEQLEQVRQKYQHHRAKDDGDSRFGSLKPQEVQTLIQEALQDRNEDTVQSQPESYTYKKKRHEHSTDNQALDNLNTYALWQGINSDREDQSSDSRTLEKLLGYQESERKKNKKSLKKYQDSYLDHLNELLSLASGEDKKQQRYQSHQAQRPKQPLLPNYLLGDTSYLDTTNRADDDLNKYSKIYVILNVDAVNTSQNQNRVTDLVSSLLSSATSQKDRRGTKRAPRYKGFLVHHGSRRSNAGDSELEFKSKRPRSHDSGRTPIPYIRHRGDIYEKD